MRQETNNEIDLLLRRLSRRHGANVPDTDHLDADELNSYAENALPAAARARYTEHLAECSRCRELVVQLSSSVGVVAAEETARAAVPSGLRKFLANLFSPMALRYAVPAMGLIIVAVIGLVVLRSRQPEGFVAQLERPAQPQAADVPSAQSQTPASGFVKAVPEQQKSQSPAATAGKRAETTKEEQQPAPPPNAPPSVSLMAETKPAEQKAPERAAANEAPAPAAPKPSVTPEEMRVEIEGRKQNEQTRGVADSQVAKDSKYQAKAEDKKTDDLAAARPSSARAKSMRAPVGTGSVAGLRSVEAEKDRDDSETRSVAGRTFRKQRGVWVDTAYSGSETTNISRGSEQYRALVADEPAIKTIAEQLDGPIIVVWKGRAYRIR